MYLVQNANGKDNDFFGCPFSSRDKSVTLRALNGYKDLQPMDIEDIMKDKNYTPKNQILCSSACQKTLQRVMGTPPGQDIRRPNDFLKFAVQSQKR